MSKKKPKPAPAAPLFASEDDRKRAELLRRGWYVVEVYGTTYYEHPETRAWWPWAALEWLEAEERKERGE